MKRLIHKSMTLLLSAMTLAGSIIPPGIAHAHMGGEEPHSHEVAHGHHHEHEHRNESDSHESSAVDDHGLGDTVPHLHFSIAGCEFSLPLPVRNESNGPLAPLDDDGDVAVVRLTDDFTIVSQVDLASIVDVSVPDCQTIGASADEDDAGARWLCGRADRIFLCDSARCERSGVLLI